MSIKYENFVKACEALERRWEQFGANTDWLDVKLYDQLGSRFLRIRKAVSLSLEQGDMADPFETLHKFEGELDDDLAVVKSETESFLSCDVVYSASYQVPVLYFQLCNTLWPSPPSLETLHSILVPDLHKTPVQRVGVVGAISKSDHPVTNVPSFFVHPCQTLAAMTSLQIGQSGEPDDYLLGWIGIIGAAVGLSVPVQMASASRT